MFGWSAFVLLLVIFFAVCCVIILFKPDEYFTRTRTLVCPETHEPVTVKVDVAHRLKSTLTNREELRLKSCSRWPDRKRCDEDCLLQIELHPEHLKRILHRWYEGKTCPVCHRGLSDTDYKQGRIAAFGSNGKMLSGTELPLNELSARISDYRPVCWDCYTRARQRAVPVLFKGDRRGPKEEAALFE